MPDPFATLVRRVSARPGVADLGSAACGEVPARWGSRTFIRFLAGRVLFDRGGSVDAAARAAVVARMLYSLHDVLRDDFTVTWLGDKETLTYWHERGPSLRQAWLATVAEPDIVRKVSAWEAMFPHVSAPFGVSPRHGWT